jgi:hypothetical protein
VIPEEYDTASSHLSCCESGCSRRKPSNLTACERMCAHSPWVPEENTKSPWYKRSMFDAKQEKRTLPGRFPTYPTFLEIAQRVAYRENLHSHLDPRMLASIAAARLSVPTASEDEEDELNGSPRDLLRSEPPVDMRFATNATKSQANSTEPGITVTPAGAHLVWVDLEPEPVKATKHQSPNSDPSEEDDLLFKDLLPARDHIPVDILQYMEKQRRLAEALARQQHTVYITRKEKLENLGRYHKEMCILGCRLRCLDPKHHATPPKHNATKHINTNHTSHNHSASSNQTVVTSTKPSPNNSTVTPINPPKFAQRVAESDSDSDDEQLPTQSAESSDQSGQGVHDFEEQLDDELPIEGGLNTGQPT